MYAEQDTGIDNSKPSLGPITPNATANGTAVEENNTAPQIQQKGHRRAALVIAIIIVIAIAILAVVYQYSNIHPSTSAYYVNLTEADLFINNYSLPSNVSTLHRINTIYTSTDPYCQNTEYIVDYLPQGISNAAQPVNFSALDQNNPAVILVAISVVDPSYLSQYNATVKSNKGYCLPIMKQISENSTFLSIPTEFYNASGYLLEMSNFTNEGLNLTSTYYIGQRPNLDWYNAAAHYHNAVIEIAEWAIAGHENTTMLYNDMNYTVASFEKYVNSKQ